MVECSPNLVEETDINIGELAEGVAGSVNAETTWGSPIMARIIAQVPGTRLIDLCTKAIGQKLSREFK